MKTNNLNLRSSRMRGLAKMANDVGSNIQSLSVSSNALSPYSNDIIIWTNISITHTMVNNGNSRIFIRTTIDFSPSLNYTSYSVSDVFQRYEPIDIFRFFYIPYLDEDEKNISTKKHRRFHQNLFDDNYARKLESGVNILENFSNKKLQETKRVTLLIKDHI